MAGVLWFSIHLLAQDHSHSIVAGGLLDTS